MPVLTHSINNLITLNNTPQIQILNLMTVTKNISVSTFLVMLLAANASGQSMQIPDQKLTIDYSGFAGTVASIPTGFTFSAVPNEGGFFDWETPPSLSANSLFALRNNAETEVLGVIYKRPATSPANIEYDYTFTNNTGSTLDELTLSIDFLQATEGSRPTEIQMSWNAGQGFTTDGITNGHAFVASTQAGTGTPSLLDDLRIESRMITYSSETGIGDGASVTFRFNFRYGDGSGSNGHVGIGEFEVSAVPEPSTFGSILGALALSAALVTRRRR